MPQKKSEQTPIAPRGSGSWGKVMEEAKPVEQIYPKLFFGGDTKEARGMVDVLVLDDEPRSVEYEDSYNDGAPGEAYVFNVEVLASTFTENTPKSTRALFVPSDPNHGLTRQMTAHAKTHGNRMKGVALRIEIAPYKNKRYKSLTRGYTVTEIEAPGSATAP